MKLHRVLAAGLFPALFVVSQLLAAPVITGFSPTFGANIDSGFITITGTGFSPGTVVVKFNGVADSGAGAVSPTSIQAHVPPGTPLGSNPIFVSVNGVSALSADDFTVIGPGPFITGFSPVAGDTNAPVTITGVHFSTPVQVKFNGTNAPGADAPTFTQINVNVPAGISTGPITVTTAAGTHTSFSNFFAPAKITGFSPSSGRAGTNVIITGKNLLGTSAVRFNGLDATSFTVISNGNAIQVTVPVNATTGTNRIITPAGSYIGNSNFVINPTINSFTPNAGPPGTPVTLTGANLNVGNPTVPTVSFNGVNAAIVTNVSFSNLVAVVPVGATTGPISVTTTNGSFTNSALFYLPPRITSFTPTNSPPGTLVAVSGTNFTDTSAVTFNGTPAAGFFVTNNNLLGAFVPANVTTGPIFVTTPAGTSNSPTRFYAAPIINNFNPTHGLPGTNVVISGLNFLDASAVRFNGTNATFTVQDNTTINATVPANAQTGPITVVAPAGTTNSALNFVLDYTSDVRVTVTDSPDPVLVGSNLVYSLTIHNSGPFAASGVTLTDTIIGQAQLKSATISQGTLNTNSFPITGDLGTLPPNADAFVTLTVVPLEFSTVTNIATVASQFTDPVPSNNSVTNTTLVQPLPLLTVRRAGTANVRVSWHAALTNYTLEFRTNLFTGNNWTNDPTPPAIIGSEFQVLEPINAANRFYRLRTLP